MSHAHVLSNIKRNGEMNTVVRVIEGKLTCSRIKPTDDVKKLGEVIGIYTSLVPASWVIDDLQSAGFIE